MAYTDITFMRDRRSVINRAKYAMHVYGGIWHLCNTQISYEMNLRNQVKMLCQPPGRYGTISSW